MSGFAKFLADDAGVVTIDWVALTAGILFVAIVVVFAIYGDGVSHLVSDVNSILVHSGTEVAIVNPGDSGG